MRKIICTFMIFILVLFSCYYVAEEENSSVKIGIIDSVLSEQVLSEYRPEKYIEISDYTTSINNVHGAYSLSIISNNTIDAEIIYISVLDENSIGQISDVAKAIDICISEHVDIICMAFSTLEDNNEVHDAIKMAYGNGIIVIAATINYSNVICYPAMYEEVISVSVGFNEKADIILKNNCLSVEILSEHFDLKGTSPYTAYVSAIIANTFDFTAILDENQLKKIKKYF